MAENSVGTATAKPKSKRHKPARKPAESESIIAESEREYIIESDGESGTEPESDSSPKWWSFGNSRQSDTGSTASNSRESIRESAETGTGPAEEPPFSVDQSKAEVTKTDTKPKRTQAKKATGAIQGEDVERLLVQTFSWIALLKQAEYWNIDDPQHEVRPWSPQAAELLNKLLAERAQQVKDSSDIMSVAFGMFILVNMRVQQDIALRKQRIAFARQQAEEQQYEEYPTEIISNGRVQNTGISKPSIFGSGGI
jgi:hypothetical protein